MIKTLDWALYYRSLGFSVLPLLPKTKMPAIASWRQLQEKAAREWEIKLWFDAMPDANVGIVTGKVSGIFVVDYDNPIAMPSMEDSKDWAYATTGRGAHYYFLYPCECHVNNRVGLLPHVDVRGNGGYVVAPPSRHPDGPFYRWVHSPTEYPITEAPKRFLDLICPPKPAHKATLRPSAGARYWAQVALEREWDSLAHAPEGHRNNALNHAAYNLGQLVGDQLLERNHVETILTDAARSVGLQEREILSTLKSGLEAGIANPRSLRARSAHS